MKSENSVYHVDQCLFKIYECLLIECSTLPHFVLSYRIVRLISKISKTFWVRVVSMFRTLRSTLIPSEPSKSIYCTFIECLLIEFYSQTYSKIDNADFRDVMSEVVDCQVYVDLFESGEVSALNKSFGNSHFEFDLDINVLNRIYKTTKCFSADDAAKIMSEFSPSVLEIKGNIVWFKYSNCIYIERSIRSIETRQLLSFEDSFKSQPNRSQDLSSKRSILSLNLGSNSSRSAKITSPKNGADFIYVIIIRFNCYFFILLSIVKRRID